VTYDEWSDKIYTDLGSSVQDVSVTLYGGEIEVMAIKDSQTARYYTSQIDYESADSAVAAIKAARALRDDDAEIHRQMMIERLNTYRMGLYPKARNGDTRAVEVLLKVEDRQAALLGLDAPKRTELSGPEGGAIQIDQDVTYSPEIRQQRIIAIFDAARRRSDPALESGQSDMDSSGGGPDISLADAG
jgi:hypothetical protein